MLLKRFLQLKLLNGLMIALAGASAGFVAGRAVRRAEH
jgi:hypothetical protein